MAYFSSTIAIVIDNKYIIEIEMSKVNTSITVWKKISGRTSVTLKETVEVIIGAHRHGYGVLLTVEKEKWFRILCFIRTSCIQSCIEKAREQQ